MTFFPKELTSRIINTGASCVHIPTAGVRRRRMHNGVELIKVREENDLGGGHTKLET